MSRLFYGVTDGSQGVDWSISVGGTFFTAFFSGSPQQDQSDNVLYQGAAGGPFSAGALYVFGDGAVRLIPYTIDQTMWYYLCDPNDGHPVNFN
jgi:hypothetical protein